MRLSLAAQVYFMRLNESLMPLIASTTNENASESSTAHIMLPEFIRCGVLISFCCILMTFGLTGCRSHSRVIRAKFIAVDDANFLKNKIGKEPLFLAFYNFNCEACSQDSFELRDLYKKYRDKGISFYAVNTGDKLKWARGFALKYSTPYPVVWDRSRKKAAEAFGITALPTYIIYDRRGRLVFSGVRRPETIEDYIVAALKGSSTAAAHKPSRHEIPEPETQPTDLPETPVSFGKGVQWREWSRETIQEATEKDMPIFLSVSTTSFGACAGQQQAGDHNYERFLKTNFIPVRVNVYERPDVVFHYIAQSRELTLTPGGTIIDSFGRSFSYSPLIEDADKPLRTYREDKEDILRHAYYTAAGLRREAGSGGMVTGEFASDVIPCAVRNISDFFCNQQSLGGSGCTPQYPYFESISFLIMLMEQYHDDGVREFINRSFNHTQRLNDSVWGGFYSGGRILRDSMPQYEKTLLINVESLNAYLDSWLHFGGKNAARILTSTYKYVETFLSPPDGMGFYTAQSDFVCSEGWKISGGDYYGLSREKREALGMPARDKTLYTADNAAAVSTYLRLSAALGWKHARKRALDTLEMLWQNAYDPSLGMRRGVNIKSSAPSLLVDQTNMLRALLDAYETTADRKYLLRAVKLADIIQSRFAGSPEPGYTLLPADEHGGGYLEIPVRPPRENALLADCFIRMKYYTGRSEYGLRVKSALSSLYNKWEKMKLSNQVYFANALFLFQNKPLELYAAGNAGDSHFKSLLAAALAIPASNKVIVPLDPRIHAKRIARMSLKTKSLPAIIICVSGNCSDPIKSPNTIYGRVLSLQNRAMMPAGHE